MVKNVVWTKTAKKSLEQIHDFYKYSADKNIVLSIVERIVTQTQLLLENPQMGTNEPLLKDRSNKYKYLIKVIIKLFITYKMKMW